MVALDVQIQEQSIPIIVTEVFLVATLGVLLYLCYHGGFTIRSPWGSCKCKCENTAMREHEEDGFALEQGQSQTMAPDLVSHMNEAVIEMFERDSGWEEAATEPAPTPFCDEVHSVLHDVKHNMDILFETIKSRFDLVHTQLESNRKLQQLDTELLANRLDEIHESL